MIANLLDRLRRAGRCLARRWPRELVLRSTGEPARVVHLVDDPAGRRCLVELADGSLRQVRPEELDSRPVLLPEAVLLHLALGLAATVATLAALASR